MEHAQRVVLNFDGVTGVSGRLNPYFNGTCSKSTMEKMEVTSKVIKS